ncbi:MAG: hypothetical protein CMJ33_01600 [Phycisphaerae bacterium]|nr:hypothetical protein [Phycisphaerae bacterium]
MRILVISTLSDLREGVLAQLRDAGHDLVVVIPSMKTARERSDLSGFALFEGDSSCPGDWQRLIEGSEVVLHLAYSTSNAPECGAEPRHVLRQDSVFQTVEAIGRATPGPGMMIVASGPSSSPDDPSDASLIKDRLEHIARTVEDGQVALHFIRTHESDDILAALSEDARCERDEPSSAKTAHSEVDSEPACLALPLESILNDPEPSKTFKMLEAIASAGVHIVPFTSSAMYEVLRHRESLQFSRYVIMGDGAALLDIMTEDVIRTELLEPTLLEELVTCARGVSPRLSIYSERGMNLISDGSIPPLAEAAGILGVAENMIEGSLHDRPATRLFIQGPPAWVGRVQSVFTETWWKSGVIALLEYHPGLLGVLPPTADRSIGLQRIETLLGAPRRSSVVLVSSPLDAGLIEIYGQTWAFGPFADVMGRHATRRFPAESPLHGLLGDFLARQSRR